MSLLRLDSALFVSARFGSTPSSVEISRQPAASVVAVTSRRILYRCSFLTTIESSHVSDRILPFFILYSSIIDVYVNSSIKEYSSEF